VDAERVAVHIDMPLRDRNALLQAAGYAPIYRETPLDDPQMAGVPQVPPWGGAAISIHSLAPCH